VRVTSLFARSRHRTRPTAARPALSARAACGAGAAAAMWSACRLCTNSRPRD